MEGNQLKVFRRARSLPLWLVFFNAVWIFRNDAIFKGKKHILHYISILERMVEDFNLPIKHNLQVSSTKSREKNWIPPTEGWSG